MKAYRPPYLPLTPDWDFHISFDKAETHADAVLAELDATSQALAAAPLSPQLLLLQEAMHSSAIEGIVASFVELCQADMGRSAAPARAAGVQDAHNCAVAMQEGFAALDRGGHLSLSMIRALHARLLASPHSARTQPGQWRTIQVYLGTAGSSAASATYIPPEPDYLPGLLENWLAFARRTDLNPLLQAGILHAQFEMIHPFCDGNGRIGRMLLPLFLAEQKAGQSPGPEPGQGAEHGSEQSTEHSTAESTDKSLGTSLAASACFFLSPAFLEQRPLYYASLASISRYGSWQEWLNFFLSAVSARCARLQALLTAAAQLHARCRDVFPTITGSAQATHIADYFFAHPLCTQPGLQDHCDITMTRQGMHLLLHKLDEAGMVRMLEPGAGRRPALWQFTELVELFA